MKTYHYCALSGSAAGQHYSSGVVQHSVDLATPAAYIDLCVLIGKRMNPPRDDGRIALLSLTVIDDGRSEEPWRCGP